MAHAFAVALGLGDTTGSARFRPDRRPVDGGELLAADEEWDRPWFTRLGRGGDDNEPGGGGGDGWGSDGGDGGRRRWRRGRLARRAAEPAGSAGSAVPVGAGRKFSDVTHCRALTGAAGDMVAAEAATTVTAAAADIVHGRGTT